MKKWIAVLFLMLLMAMLSACDEYSSSSNYSSRGGMSAEERYDAKYGKGSYASDKEFMDEMRDAWNSMTGK